MRLRLDSDDFSERQIRILELLFEKEYQQKDLQEALDKTAPNLHYHLTRLEEIDLIRKKTLYQVGNVKINSISLNPAARQQARKIIGKEVTNYTLITGFGKLGKGYQVPDLVFKELRKYNYPITRIVCFTTKESKVIRDKHVEEEGLVSIDEYFPYDDLEYRHIESEFVQTTEIKLSKEMEKANIIIDLTPLSKLFSFRLLELANKYLIPCVYLGLNKEEKPKLYWMSNLKIEGTIESFT